MLRGRMMTIDKKESREAEAEKLLDELVTFCMERNGGRCFADWPRETVRAYILFHMRQRTFAFVRTSGVPGVTATVAGCGIIWQGNAAKIQGAIGCGQSPFRWQATDPNGDSLFLEEFVCAVPGALRAIAREFARRFSAWPRLKVLTLRRRGGKDVIQQYPATVLRRIVKERIYDRA